MASYSLAFLRNTYFRIFPVDVFGKGPKMNFFGDLKRAIRSRQKAVISSSLAVALPLAPRTRTGLRPTSHPVGNDSDSQHRRMAVQHILQLDGEMFSPRK